MGHRGTPNEGLRFVYVSLVILRSGSPNKSTFFSLCDLLDQSEGARSSRTFSASQLFVSAQHSKAAE